MCGINIAIGNPKRVLEMNAKIKHRGIVSNFTIRENIGFGGVRLPIQGLNNKYNTPYQTQKHIILYNGEIYNFKEISKTAECDIQLLEEDFDPAMFDGDFAIVKYDKEKEKIEITTDRFGKKQLYYKYENYISGISSEIKALISEKDKIDKYYLSTVAKFGYVFNSDNTAIRNIKKFLPGKKYTISNGGQIEKIESVKWDSSKLIPKNHPTDLKSLMKLSIKRRIVSDIPISLVFSGGLDSSIVLYHLNNLKANFKAFTVLNSDDYKYAKRYAKELGITMEYIKHFESFYDDAHFYNECAVDLGSVMPKFSLLKAIKKNGIRVTIGGTGADEVFGGYKRMLQLDYQQSDIYNELIYYHLPRVERVSMANTVEYRTPYTADYIIDFGLQLPYEERINKKYLRNTYKNILPEYILKQEKRPLKIKDISKDKIKYRLKLIKDFKAKIFRRLKNGI